MSLTTGFPHKGVLPAVQGIERVDEEGMESEFHGIEACRNQKIH